MSELKPLFVKLWVPEHYKRYLKLIKTIEHRDTIADEIQSVIGPSALSWGAKVESILIKDLKFSQDLQENLSAAAKQKRIGESKVIAAQAEVDSAKLLRQAADILSSPAAMQIRYLDTMNAMARNANSKVIFMPASGSGDEDMVKHMKQQMMLGEI